MQFTIEKENDRKIAFLDILVEGTFAITSAFCKKTHTDKYVNYNSHHHARIKSGQASSNACGLRRFAIPPDCSGNGNT